MNSLPPEMEAFLEYVLVVRGQSVRTEAVHRQGLADFLSVVEDWKRAGLREIEAYVSGLSRRKAAASTQALRLSTLRAFYRFLRERGWRDDDPTAEVPLPKKTQLLPKALTESDMRKLLAAPVGETPAELRLRAVLQLLYACGMRVSELANLTLADVDEGAGVVLRVTGKGEKTRLVPLGEAAGATLQAYLHQGRPYLAGSTGEWVFAGPNGRHPLTRARLWQLVKEAGDRVGLEVHPHQLRHTFATHLLNHDADLRAVQVMLGHASLNTTQVYTKVADKRVRDVLERFHPLNRPSK